MSEPQTRIFIQNLELLVRIGIHGHERGKPQPVRINVWLASNGKTVDDHLEKAIDYEAVADKIRTIIALGHINLAESLAERIADACLEDKRVVKVGVKVAKLHALAGAEAAGVEIEREANR
jgi:dihydroneopterin aldolase